MFGGYGAGGEALPRVLYISLALQGDRPVTAGTSATVLLTIHEEGTGLTWKDQHRVSAKAWADLTERTAAVRQWASHPGTPHGEARGAAETLGRRLFKVFVGTRGRKYLESVPATAYLLAIDEQLLDLPWELLHDGTRALVLDRPLGRVVTTALVPMRGRDPLSEDRVVRMLAVANPTEDLAASAADLQALERIRSDGGAASRIEVDILGEKKATLAGFEKMVAKGDYDMLHFTGHASFHEGSPGDSGLRLADGMLRADQVAALPWKAAPYFVFNSACQSGRAGARRRLVSGGGRPNGLAAAFLSAGCLGYAGYTWPVTDAGANRFSRTFYAAMFGLENVGAAFQMARQEAVAVLADEGDLTGYSAVLFGDAASKHRRTLAEAV